ncbi:MAG: flagellar biosynthesis anti-sigma factor FlgM [Dehalococcoidia bacterium]
MVQSVRPQDASSVYRRTLGAVAPGEAAAASPRPATAARSRRTDSVALSDQAQLLARALDATTQATDTRAALVASLRASVQDGTYVANAGDTAAAMLAADAAEPIDGAQA